MTASLTASRISQNTVAAVETGQAKSTISVDRLRQGVTVSKTSRSEYPVPGRGGGVIGIPHLGQRGEPVSLQLDHFVDCVMSGR